MFYPKTWGCFAPLHNILQPGVPDDVKYILFKRLNTGGVELTAQEIRNSMFQGPAIELVKKLASDENFLAATRHKIPTRRKQDQDFVSRFMAFYLIGYENYSPDIESFINSSMKMVNEENVSAAQIDTMCQAFSEAMHLAASVFGNDAFRKISNGKRGPINKALFEVIAVTFAKLSRYDRLKLESASSVQLKKELTDELVNDAAFSYALSTTTGRPDNVKTRFQTFEKIVKKILEE